MSKLEILAMAGFEKDPFGGEFQTADQTRVERLVKMAVASGSMISIVGERGIGKTRAIGRALQHMKARIVRPYTPDRPRLAIGDIEQAMIFDLSDESPKRSREVRSRQLRRILGEAAFRSPVVVVLEEGHRFHGGTLRALKTMREFEWMGKTNLFSVILAAQSDPMQKPGVSEVRLRSDTVVMTGLSIAEVGEYIRQTMGAAVEESAIPLLSAMPGTRNFLDLQACLLRSLATALSAGRNAISPEDVQASDAGQEIPKTGTAEKGRNALRNLLKERRNADGKERITAAA